MARLVPSGLCEAWRNVVSSVAQKPSSVPRLFGNPMTLVRLVAPNSVVSTSSTVLSMVNARMAPTRTGAPAPEVDMYTSPVLPWYFVAIRSGSFAQYQGSIVECLEIGQDLG